MFLRFFISVVLAGLAAQASATGSIDEVSLAQNAYRGFYEEAGIPGWGDLCDHFESPQSARAMADLIVDFAIDTGLVDAQTADAGYRFGVEQTLSTVYCADLF